MCTFKGFLAARSGPSMARDTFKGSAEQIADALDAVASSGRSFLVCSSSPVISKAKCVPAEIKDAHEVLGIMRSLQTNLSFPEKVVREAVGILYERHKAKPGWALKDADVAGYVLLMQQM